MDSLFAAIASLHGAAPWGSVLDAGTGRHSLRWIAGLPARSWTAVTADRDSASDLERMCADLPGGRRPADRIIVGNWTDPELLAGSSFDVVLADYLLGALDGFAPYWQDRLFARLRPHTGGLLYVVGLEPYPDGADSEGGRLILEIARLRDACILLAGHRCYREYPLDWTERRLAADGYEVQAARRFPIVYRRKFVDGQLDVCLRKLPLFRDRALAHETERHVADVRKRALRLVEAGDGIRFGEDWVVQARPR